MRRWLLLLAPVLVTVLIAAAIGGYIVVQGQRQAQQTEEADAVAADYLSQVGVFRKRALEVVSDAKVDDPQKVRQQLSQAVRNPPELPGVGRYGRDSSGAYQSAEEIAATLLDPYRRLDTSLKKADVSFDYVKAARRALDLRVEDYVDSTTLSSSTQLRSSLIPAFQKARQDLDQVTVPPGQAKLADTVDGALAHVVDEATTLANNIDARRNYSFTYDQEFNAAITAVEEYATAVGGDLTEELNALSDL